MQTQQLLPEHLVIGDGVNGTCFAATKPRRGQESATRHLMMPTRDSLPDASLGRSFL